MVLLSPRYPELEDILDWREKQQFFIPELEMTYGEVCSSFKKAWRGYKLARLQGDEENVQFYARIIRKLRTGLGYKKTAFYPLFMEDFEENVEEEVEEIEQKVSDAMNEESYPEETDPEMEEEWDSDEMDDENQGDLVGSFIHKWFE
jgi:hypothetical protein